MPVQAEASLPRKRLAQLFEYLKAYTDLRYPPVREIDRQLRTLWLDDMPVHNSVDLRRDAGRTEEEGEDEDIIFSLARPTLTQCPTPPEPIRDWIKPGWRDLPGICEALASRTVTGKDGHTRIERFTEDTRRSQERVLDNLPDLFPAASVANKTPAAEGKFEAEIVSILRTRGRLDTGSLVIELAKKYGLDDSGRRQIRSALDRLEAKGVIRLGANYVALSTA